MKVETHAHIVAACSLKRARNAAGLRATQRTGYRGALSRVRAGPFISTELIMSRIAVALLAATARLRHRPCRGRRRHGRLRQPGQGAGRPARDQYRALDHGERDRTRSATTSIAATAKTASSSSITKQADARQRHHRRNAQVRVRRRHDRSVQGLLVLRRGDHRPAATRDKFTPVFKAKAKRHADGTPAEPTPRAIECDCDVNAESHSGEHPASGRDDAPALNSADLRERAMRLHLIELILFSDVRRAARRTRALVSRACSGGSSSRR